MQQVLGLSPAERQVLTYLIAHGYDREELETQFGEDVHRIIESLRDQRAVYGDPPTPVQPSLVFGRKLLEETSVIVQSQEMLADLERLFQLHSFQHQATQPFELLSTAEQVGTYFEAVYDTAQVEVVNFSTSPYIVTSQRDNPSQRRAANRGVRTRIIAEAAVLAEDSGQYGLRHALTTGDEVRAVDSLPMKLLVADRSIGMIPLHQPGHPDVGAVLLLRGSNLLEAVVCMFEYYWERAIPLYVGEDEVVIRSSSRYRLSQRDRVILGALLRGASDQTIATTLGVSVRTVQRDISDLMSMAGVTTRMQLGYLAHMHGWVNDVPLR
ncbi:helix-turn-helix transcriptional regulator [Nonomuraea sp. SYSU D8015]|uniref:helix-turn-helix transcriptional regulator n=1 Tax=Nonomuraea sp. SYSU D8015 TaxID=2593644 RepID=UPI001661430E|nr:LuxR C-terminal-related transcriptional regulator [Nonomuraea sp. SYSU D8015]